MIAEQNVSYLHPVIDLSEFYDQIFSARHRLLFQLTKLELIFQEIKNYFCLNTIDLNCYYVFLRNDCCHVNRPQSFSNTLKYLL